MNRVPSEPSALRLMLLALPLSLFVLVAEGQQNRRSFLDNFTGDIAVVDSAEMNSSRIRFEAGARTNWHVHSERQLLLIEQGQGRMQEKGSAVRTLREGESFYTQAGLTHWHGASPDQAAVQFSVYSGTLEWQASVTDDEYLGR
jgi:quercetin dioxygenase-like cupin family protein